MTVVSKPPLQSRSRQTLAALLAATEALLETRAFAEVSIQEICAAAGCTTGSFYGRFRSKDDLLAYLHDHHDAALAARLETALESRDWGALSLAAALELYVRGLIAAHRQTHVQREITLYGLRNLRPRGRTAGVTAHIAAILARKTPNAPPGEPAFILETLATAVRETMLFSSSPPAPADTGTLVRRLIWMGLVHLETRT